MATEVELSDEVSELPFSEELSNVIKLNQTISLRDDEFQSGKSASSVED